MATVGHHTALKRDAIGLVSVLSQSVATVGPAVGVAGAIIVTTYAGASTPLAVVLSLAGCLLVAVAIGGLSRHVSSAGGLYSNTAAGPGKCHSSRSCLGIHSRLCARARAAQPNLGFHYWR